MLDFSIIPSGEDFEFFCRDLLQLLGAQIETHPSRGQDQGADIIATLKNKNEFGFEYPLRVAVECKHFAASNRSVKETDVGSFVERTLRHNCDHYLLITSTLASTSLSGQIAGVTNNPSIPIRAAVWTKVELEKYVEQFPSLRTRYFSRPIAAAADQSEGRRDPDQVVAIHLHPDFSDELQELVERWSNAQTRIGVMAFKPPRELEMPLISSRRVINDEDGYKIASAIRLEGGFEHNDGIILFCEGRLHSSDTYQLFSLTWPRRGLIDVSMISLRMTRKLADDENLTKAPIFSMVTKNLLYSFAVAAGLKSHDVSRACIMDYCNNMVEIKLGLKFGPKFCPQCEKTIRSKKLSYLSDLGAVAREFLNPNQDRKVAKRMELRLERDADLSLLKYQVALSFAGEDRKKAEELARALKKRGVKVFYDGFEKDALWGVDLYSYLSELYRFKARYCVMLISRDYAKKVWTNHERKAAQARAFEDNRTYILPIRIDDVEVPGILPTIGYLRWQDENPESIADLIAEKLQAESARDAR